MLIYLSRWNWRCDRVVRLLGQYGRASPEVCLDEAMSVLADLLEHCDNLSAMPRLRNWRLAR